MHNTMQCRRRSGGQTVVEFALVLPLLLLLVMGILEFGRIWMTQNAITNAAREGARKAVLPSSGEATVTTMVENYLTGAGLNLENAATTVTNEGPSGEVGDDVTVTVTYDLPIMVGGIVGLGSSLELTSSSVMRHE